MAFNGDTTMEMLLEQSNSLLPQGDAISFPTLHRSVDQLEETSRKLKAKSSQVDPNAAARLLAQKGINVDRLNRNMRSFELSTTFEEIFPLEGATVEEYLQKVHDMTLVAAIEKENQLAVQEFESFMLDCAQADWEQQPRDGLFHLGQSSAAAATTHPVSASSATTTAMSAQQPAGGTDWAGSGEIGGRAGAYLAGLTALNTARLSNAPFDVMKEFQAAAAKTTDTLSNTSENPILGCWKLLSAMVPVSSPLSVGSLVTGARKHLEAGHREYLLEVVRKHAQVARLGGDTSTLARVHAFLRVSLHGQGPLDFDGGVGGVETGWRVVFYLVRSGHLTEAVQAAKQARDPHAAHTGVHLSDALQEWVSGSGSVSAGTSLALAQQCRRILHASHSQQDSSSSADRNRVYLLVLYCLLCGDAKVATQFLLTNPAFFSTIQDFMWFKLSLIRTEEETSLVAGAPQDSVYTLQDLQCYLKQYPASHYSREGQEPMKYVQVLLLSLQFKAALHYLLTDQATVPFRVDAVHLAVALLHCGALEVCEAAEPQDPNQHQYQHHHQQGAFIRDLRLPDQIANYAQGLASVHPVAALEYLAFAGSQLSSSSTDRGTHWLSALLQTPQAVHALLGADQVPEERSPLARFLPHPSQRRTLLLDAADNCRAKAKYDEAMELYRRAGEPASALELINQLLGDCLGGPNAALATSDPHLARLQSQGSELLARSGASGSAGGDDPALRQQQGVFQALKTITQVFNAVAQGRNVEAVQLLKEVQHIPLDAGRVQLCLDNHQWTSQGATPAGAQGGVGGSAVAKVIPQLVLAAAQALHRLHQGSSGPNASQWKDQLRAVTDFGARIPMTSDVRGRLATLAPSM